MRFRFVVDVEVERDQGKFASRDTIAEEISSSLEGADPGTIDNGHGDGGSYSVTSWDVSEEEA